MNRIPTPAAALVLVSCAADVADTEPVDVLPPLDGLTLATDPDPPAAGEGATLEVGIYRDGQAFPLVDTHEAPLHLFVLGPDLGFEHLHPAGIADPLIIPWSPPYAGGYRMLFEYADATSWAGAERDVAVIGEPAAPAPDLGPVSIAVIGAVEIELSTPSPVAGSEVPIEVLVRADGAETADLVQWHGSDGHLVWTLADRSVSGHAHAYVPGRENAPPGSAEPHRYPGPIVPFRTTFPVDGRYVLWVQIARAADPDVPITGRLVIDVAAP